MALIAHIYLNDTPLGYVAAVRREPLLDPDSPDDEVHEYEISCVMNGRAYPTWRIKHRYGDGALALVSKMTKDVT